MRIPTDLELEQLAHVYDPVKAREYYLKTRDLKGRKKGLQKVAANPHPVNVKVEALGKTVGKDPRTGKTVKEIHKGARAKQRKDLTEAIQKLEGKLKKLEALIKERTHNEKSVDRKGKAKKERAAKEADKPASAAEKADNARQNKKFRDKNQQTIKSKAKQDNNAKPDTKASGGGSSKSSKSKSSSKASVSSLKALATKVRGQISVAKQKLASL